MSREGRIVRGAMLGLMKTCGKLNPSFWHHLGRRFGIAGDAVRSCRCPIVPASGNRQLTLRRQCSDARERQNYHRQANEV